MLPDRSDSAKQRRADRRTEQRRAVQQERARYLAALSVIANDPACDMAAARLIARMALDGTLTIATGRAA